VSVNKILSSRLNARLAIACVVLSLAALGCSTTGKDVAVGPTCPVPSGYDLEAGIAQGLESVRACPHKYDRVFTALLEIAKTEAAPDNKKRLYDFASTLAADSAVPADSTREQFRRYFDQDFVAVPHGLSVAAQCKTLDELETAMKAELRLKRQGILEAMGDEEGFLAVESSYRAFLDSMEIVCSTFEEGGAGW